MFTKSLLILGGLASLIMVAAPAADAQSYGNRRAYCDDYARRAAFRPVNPGDVVGGAVGGAILGGVVGAVTGQGRPSNVGTGAVVGGVAGGTIGAVSSNGRIDRRAYNRAYYRCMNRDQFRARRAYDGPPRDYDRPGYERRSRFTREMRYCASRYRSYNPDTGMYLSYDGEYRRCP